MLKRHNKNFNSLRGAICSSSGESYSGFRETCSRKISCFFIAEVCFKLSGVCLFLLTFLLINPATTSVSALETELTSQSLDSRVEISFTPTEVSGEMIPTTEAGVKKQLETSAQITVQNAENYTIYIGAKTTGLVGVNKGEAISSIKTATNYDELPANSWGIYYGEGTSVPENAVYNPVEINRGTKIGTGGRTTSEIIKTYVLGFAANINNEVPADTYQNQITLSVISSPLEITGLTSITKMQEMTFEVCAASELGDTNQLIDLRDNKSYWVAKLPDNNCWMTQNLDLDLGAEWPDANPSDYDAINTEYKPVATATTATSTTVDASNTATRSWSLGKFVITNPDSSTNCGAQKNSFADCASQFTNVANIAASMDANFYTSHKQTVFGNEYDAHYLVGNHYQWNTATAGTGGTITSGQASGSICPKGWKLPASNGALSFEGLAAAGDISGDPAKITTSPYYFVKGGYVSQYSNGLLNYAGWGGYYWTDTSVSSSEVYAYSLSVEGTDAVNPVNAEYGRRNGIFVRCVAR